MNEEESILNQLLINKCKEEGIVMALVAINKNTNEVELPQSITDKVNNPYYYVCYCYRNDKGEYTVEKIEESQT